MSFFSGFQKILSKILGVICVIVFSVLVIDVLWGVFTRQVLDNQPAWTEELARLLLVWLSILGGVLAYADDAHLGVDVLVSHFASGTHKLARLVSHICVFLFSMCALVIGGGMLFQDRLASGQMMATLGIAKAWFYFILPLGGVLICFLAIEKILSIMTTAQTEEQV